MHPLFTRLIRTRFTCSDKYKRLFMTTTDMERIITRLPRVYDQCKLLISQGYTIEAIAFYYPTTKQ